VKALEHPPMMSANRDGEQAVFHFAFAIQYSLFAIIRLPATHENEMKSLRRFSPRGVDTRAASLAAHRKPPPVLFVL
jgi:hypothetical protein